MPNVLVQGVLPRSNILVRVYHLYTNYILAEP